MKLKKLDEGIIFGSADPKKGDKSGYMPFFCPMEDGTILVAQTISSYFDAPDGHTYLLRSTDGGKTYVPSEKPIANFAEEKYNVMESFKLTRVSGEHLVAIGYGFIQDRETSAPPCNPDVPGGLLDTPIFFMESFDGGKTFTPARRVASVWGPHCEASAPIVVLPNGDYITPIAAMPDWNNGYLSPMCGRMLRSTDGGKTWDDSTVIMDFGPDTTVWEQRTCVTDTGKVVDIAWVENLAEGKLHNNFAAISLDGGKTFGEPLDTGIHGQAACVCPLKGDKILSIHSMRKDVDKYGVQVCIVDVSDGKWNVESREYVWEPPFVMSKREGIEGVFDMLKFGQPSMFRVDEKTVLYAQWLMENDVCRTIWQKYEICD